MPVALVTGTSSGFGRGTAERLVALGWTVAATVRDPAQTAVPQGCDAVALDLRDPGSIVAAAADVQERYGRLDALVSNAGIAILGPVEELSLAELRDQLEVNLFGTLDLCRACLPLLREAQGVIVQVSSVSGRMGDSAFAAYCASKFALEGASECLAAELAPQGVRVVIVEPGPFTTPIAGKGMNAAARGATGLYDAVWQEVDEFTAFIADGAEDPAIAVDAIVAAVTVPGAPLRLPVGKNNGNWLRESFAEALRDVERAEEFLAAHPRPGR